MGFKEFREEISYKDIFAVLFVIVTIIVALQFTTSDELQEMVVSFGVVGILIFIIAKASTLVFAPLSGTPFYAVAPLLFGLELGILYTIIGDILGHSICFYLSRLYGHRILSKLLSDKVVNRIDELVKGLENVKKFFFVRFGLFFIVEIVSYAAGLSKLKFRYFFTITLIATIVFNIITVLFLDRIISFTQGSYSSYILGGLGLIGLIAIILFMIPKNKK